MPRGTYSNTTTSANDAVTTSVEQDCFPCDAGTYQDETGSTACKICMPGKYQPNTGSVDCQLCTNHLTSVAGSSNCAFCKEGFYLDGFYLDDTSIDNQTFVFCKKCPDGANCPDNTNLRELPMNPGFWRASNKTAELYPCNHNGDDDEPVCKGYNATNLTHLQSEIGDIYCAVNHRGPLCELCVYDETEYFDQSTGRCNTCPSTSGLFLRGSVVFMIALALVLIGSLIISRLSAFSLFFTSLNVQAKAKILIGFYQIISSFSEVYGVSMDAKFQAWYEDLINIFSLDFFQLLYIPTDCVGNKTVNFFFSVCWPYILCSVLIALLLFCVIIGEIMGKTKSTDVKSRFGMKSLYIVIVVFYVALPTVSRTIISAMKCTTFKTNDANNNNNSKIT